jgi:hypothetical protein
MRYKIDAEGLPRLKSGELCLSRNWLATIKALSLLPNGTARTAKELADTASKHGLANWWNLYQRWHRIPRSLVRVRSVRGRYEITLTNKGWEIMKSGNFGRIY